MNRSRQQIIRGLRNRLTGTSSSSATRPCSLTAEPSIYEMDSDEFRQELRDFYGVDVRHIANNPQEYLDFVSSKAERTAIVARVGATVDDEAGSKYFSYQLGDNDEQRG